MFGCGRVKRTDDIEPGIERGAKPGCVSDAVDRALRRRSCLGRDQRQALCVGEAHRAQLGERHNTIDHGEVERGLRVDLTAEIEEFARPLVADDHRHHDGRANRRKSHFRFAECRVVRGDRQVTHFTSSHPPPSTWPCTEAITGFFISQGAISNPNAVVDARAPWSGRCAIRRPQGPSRRCRIRRRSCDPRHAAARRSSLDRHRRARRRRSALAGVHDYRVELIRPIERHDADFVVNVVKD